MKTLTGIVKDSKGSGVYGAKLFISDASGNFLYDKSAGAISDFDGKFKIFLPPELVRTTRRLQVIDPNSGARSSALIKDNQTNYIFDGIDKGTLSQSLDEVVIRRKRPTPKPKKKNYTPFFIGGGILLALLLGYLVYEEMKEKWKLRKKKKKKSKKLSFTQVLEVL